jgi:phage shock protein A
LDSSGADEVAKLKESESKLQQQVEEFTRRDNVLKMRLATKQQELQELMVSLIH